MRRQDWWLLGFIVFFAAGVAMAEPNVEKYDPETEMIPALICKSIHGGEAAICMPLDKVKDTVENCSILSDGEAYFECIQNSFLLVR